MNVPKFLLQNHRAALRLQHKMVTHLFAVRRVLKELREQLGEKGLKQWMRMNCPQISWEDVTFILSQPKTNNLNPERLKEIIRDARN